MGGGKKNQSYQFLLKFKPPLVTRPSISCSFTRLRVGLFRGAHCSPAIALLRACFLSSEPFRALTGSVKESVLSYNINTDITSFQRRDRSLIWRFSSNEFHVVIDNRDKWVMELLSHFALCVSLLCACLCVCAHVYTKCSAPVTSRLMTVLQHPPPLPFPAA